MIATIYGPSSVGKTTLAASYCDRMLVLSPDIARTKFSFSELGRTTDLFFEVKDVGQLWAALQTRLALDWKGVILIEDFSVLANNFIQRITAAIDPKTNTVIHVHPEFSHWGQLRSTNTQIWGLLKMNGARALITTHPTGVSKNKDGMQVGMASPEAGNRPASTELAKVSDYLGFLHPVLIGDNEDVQGFTSRFITMDGQHESRLPTVQRGEHCPFLPRIMPELCMTFPSQTPHLPALGKVLADHPNKRQDIVKQALSQGFNSRQIQVAYQQHVWANSAPPIVF
jgi:hypothetical protein